MDTLDTFSVLVFFVTTFIFTLLILLGRKLFKKYGGQDDLLKIVLGSVLSFLALLIGFCMSIAIAGFNDSQAAERKEALSIYSAYLYSDLLTENNQAAKNTIKEYLDLRIQFYKSGNQLVGEQSQQKQIVLWNIFSEAVKKNDVASMNSSLSSINHLIESQKTTTSLWRTNVPILAWCIIYFLSGAACLILGYNIKAYDKILVIIIFPIILSAVFFIIQQIDTPNESLVGVDSSDLESVYLQIK